MWWSNQCSCHSQLLITSSCLKTLNFSSWSIFLLQMTGLHSSYEWITFRGVIMPHFLCLPTDECVVWSHILNIAHIAVKFSLFGNLMSFPVDVHPGLTQLDQVAILFLSFEAFFGLSFTMATLIGTPTINKIFLPYLTFSLAFAFCLFLKCQSDQDERMFQGLLAAQRQTFCM